MTINFDFLESDTEITKRIHTALAKDINKLIRRRRKRIERDLKKAIPGWILSQPEAISLAADGIQGSLNAQFGLVPGQGAIAMQQIAQAVASSTIAEFSPVSPKNFSGGLTFKVQPTNFFNLLSLSSGFTIATSLADPSSYDGELHWLSWLLQKGDSIIVAGYSYFPEAAGRSGGGTMKPGKSFRVDPSFSGTQENNFITRAFRGQQKQISNIITNGIRV